MDYWPSRPWTAKVTSSKARESTVELELPFALIGSHPDCNIQINKRRGPKLAYVAISFGDSLEVWPLCALAFAQWGLLSGDQKLRVGRSSIQLIQENEGHEGGAGNQNVWSQQAFVPETPAILQVDYHSQIGTFVLDRRVVILGNNHPSTRRLHGVGLSRCDQAVISVGAKCWLVNLQTDIDLPIEDRITQLVLNGEQIKIGKINISSRSPNQNQLAKFRESSARDLPLSSNMHQFEQNYNVTEKPDSEPIVESLPPSEHASLFAFSAVARAIKGIETSEENLAKHPAVEIKSNAETEHESVHNTDGEDIPSVLSEEAGGIDSSDLDQPELTDEPLDSSDKGRELDRSPNDMGEVKPIVTVEEISGDSQRHSGQPGLVPVPKSKKNAKRKSKSRRWATVDTAGDNLAVSKKHDTDSSLATDVEKEAALQANAGEPDSPPVGSQIESLDPNVAVQSATDMQPSPSEASSDVSRGSTLASLDVERVASSITDRMVSKEQSKWWKRRVFKISLVAIIFLVSLAVVIWIVANHVLPSVFDWESM